MTTTIEGVEFTDEQLMLLQTIMGDRYSRGGFCGMIFNAYVDNKGTVEELLQKALLVRVRADTIAKEMETI